MKKVKIALWVIVIVFFGLVIFQNKAFFMVKQSLGLKLPFLAPYHTPEVYNAVIFLVFFLLGFLIAYVFSLYDRFKNKKTIKNLNAAATAQVEEISSLKGELESLKAGSFKEEKEPEAEDAQAT